jgi:hypothetical protein
MTRRIYVIARQQPLIAALMLVLLGVSRAAAQETPPPLPVDPTPLKDLLSAEERSQVTMAHNNMKLVDIYLDISDKHLRAADGASDAGDFKSAERELDIYNKAAAEASTIAFSGENRNKLGKRIEQRLYAQIRALEVIDRRFPADAVGYPDAALDHARQLRAHALNQTLAVGKVLVESKDGKDGDGKGTQEGKKEKPDSDPTAKPGPNPPTKRPQYFLPRSPVAGRAQLSGDYMTEQENEDVREAQEIDGRIKVFMKIAGHRLALLTHNPEDDAKKSGKKSGKEPDQQEKDEIALSKLSHAELLRHYSRAIQETMDKLDDAHERNPKSGALTKALVTLRDSTDKQLSILHSLEPRAKDQAEADALRQAIKDAEEANKGAHQALSGKT